VHRLRLSLVVAVVVASALGVVAAGAHATPEPALALTATIAPPPEHRADARLQTHVVRLGPFVVDGYGAIKRSDRGRPPPVAGSIVAMDARVVDARGRPIPQHVVMLHHFLMTNAGADGRRHDATCPHRPVNERFYGTSEELRAMTFPRGYGYPSTPLDRWRTIWMVMNHRPGPREIYLEYRVTVDPRPLTPVQPYWLSVLPCGPVSQYTVPGASTAVQRRQQRYVLPAGGRIVAVGGHLHGGALGLRIGQPRCGDRELVTSRPTYAPPKDPVYAVTPLLHEPDPESMSWWQSATGWPVVGGEQLKVTAAYEGRNPHMRVMGIAHVYVAVDPAASTGCAAPPADAQVLGAGLPGGRASPPAVRLTLAHRGGDGLAREISRPPGRIDVAARAATVVVRRFAFSPANLSIAAGGVVRWKFLDPGQHDVTVVTGPRGFAAEYSDRGSRFAQRLAIPGEYRLYCSLHPTVMSQYIRVRPARRSRR
jgi:plastocyanin